MIVQVLQDGLMQTLRGYQLQHYFGVIILISRCSVLANIYSTTDFHGPPVRPTGSTGLLTPCLQPKLLTHGGHSILSIFHCLTVVMASSWSCHSLSCFGVQCPNQLNSLLELVRTAPAIVWSFLQFRHDFFLVKDR